MSKEEFEKIINEKVSFDDYRIIEKVYIWHPAIPPVGGKEIIAKLYLTGGMAVIKDMLSTAKGAENKEALRDKIRRTKETINKLNVNLLDPKETNELSFLLDKTNNTLAAYIGI